MTFMLDATWNVDENHFCLGGSRKSYNWSETFTTTLELQWQRNLYSDHV